MSKKLIARRPFYSDTRIEGPKRIIPRGQEFYTDDLHAQQLMAQRIAEPIKEAGNPEPVTGVTPSETQTIRPENTQTQEPEQIPTDRPDETKDEEPQEAPQELNEEPPALSYQELKKAAKEAGIKGYNRMSKEDLIKNLRGGNNNGRS